MADYSSWKVTDLKAELKRRGIPQTGLRLKQQIIEKLQEADSAAQHAPEEDANQPEPAGAESDTEQKLEHQEVREPGSEPRVEDSEAQEKPSLEAPIDESTAEADVAPPAAGPTVGSQSQDTATAANGASEPVPAKTVVESAPEQTPVPNEEKPSLPEPTDQSIEPVKQDTATSQPSAEVTPAEDAQVKIAKQDVPPQPAVSEATPAEGEGASAPELSREESIDDSKKRKRRSQSPPPSPRTMALKRAKLENGEPKDVVGQGSPENEESQAAETSVSPPKESAVPPRDADVEMTTEDQVRESLVEHTGGHVKRPPIPRPEGEKDENKEMKPVEPEVQGTERAEEADESHSTRKFLGDARFKGLFPPTNGEQLRHEHASHPEEEERMVEAALHPATTSLYIRDFMRPLQPSAVKTHLASLAAPPGSSPSLDTILTFFLDSIKTHCFVTFPSVAAASRVRTALHGTIWPEERSRKPLWVDFVPEEKVQEWIDTEQASGNGGRGAPRWEVCYEETDDGISAILREAVPPPIQGRGPHIPPPPAGPRADRDLARGGPPRDFPAHGFQALDDRFLSTAAKPKLYYLPVSKEVANKRLDRFDDLARAGPVDKRGGDEMRKYTFEDTDFFVDKGPEYGRRGRGGGRGGRGRFHDDFGGSWRGRW